MWAFGSTLAGAGMLSCGGAPAVVQTAAAPPAAQLEEAPPPRTAAPDSAASAELAAGIRAFDAGRYSDARASFEAAVKKSPSDSGALYNLGQSCEKLGDKPAAERAYKAALVAKPDLEPASAELTALYTDEGKLDDALSVARSGLAKAPASSSLHENLGVALAARGEEGSARKELEEAARIAPSEPMLHLTLAHWLNVWRAGGAQAHLETAARLSKSDYGMLASIGHEYRMGGDFASCIRTFDRAIGIKDGGEVRTERALCHHGLKDDKGTMDDLEAAVVTEPSYAPAHFYLGGRFATAKRFKEAAAEYARYLELEPRGSLSSAAHERLKASRQAAMAAATTK